MKGQKQAAAKAVPLTPKQKAKEQEKKNIQRVNDQVNSYLQARTLPPMEQEIEQLQQEKEKLLKENEELSAQKLGILRRNNDILEQLRIQSLDYDKKLAKIRNQFDESKAKCEAEIIQKKKEIHEDYKKAEQILIKDRQRRNHIKLDLSEKRDVEETRKMMLAKQDNLTKEFTEIKFHLKNKAKEFERKQMELRTAKTSEFANNLKTSISNAKSSIDSEIVETLNQAQEQSEVLHSNVIQSQNVVVSLRNKYNLLLEEANKLEMQLMEAKLVTQLTKPEHNQNEIGKLRDELARLEDAKIKSRSAPEAENRRKTTQHANSMKKLRNELNGFMKLNQIKLQELT